MEWFTVQSSGILRGSMSNSDDTTQIIWVKYMAMANEAHDPFSGRLEFAKGDPYSIEYLAMQCRKTVPEVLRAEQLFMADLNKSDGTTPRLFIEPDGTRVLMNWTSKQNRKEIKPRKDKLPQSIENAPLTADERKQKGEIAALELAYKYPEKAIQGIDRRGFDEALKIKCDVNSETGEIT